MFLLVTHLHSVLLLWICLPLLSRANLPLSYLLPTITKDHSVICKDQSMEIPAWSHLSACSSPLKTRRGSFPGVIPGSPWIHLSHLQPTSPLSKLSLLTSLPFQTSHAVTVALLAPHHMLSLDLQRPSDVLRTSPWSKHRICSANSSWICTATHRLSFLFP